MKRSAAMVLLLVLIVPMVIMNTMQHSTSVDAVAEQLRNTHSTSNIFSAVTMKGTKSPSSIRDSTSGLVGNAPDIMFAKTMLERHAQVEEMAKMVIMHGESPAMKQIASEMLVKDNTVTTLIETWLTTYHPDMLAQP